MSTKKNRKLKTNRRYSQTFKQARVDDFENGTFSVAQMSRLYDIRAHVIYRCPQVQSSTKTNGYHRGST